MIINDMVIQKIHLNKQNEQIVFIYYENKRYTQYFPCRQMCKLLYIATNGFENSKSECDC